MNELTGRRALVLGTDAIGSGIAVRFAREGAALAILDADLPPPKPSPKPFAPPAVRPMHSPHRGMSARAAR